MMLRMAGEGRRRGRRRFFFSFPSFFSLFLPGSIAEEKGGRPTAKEPVSGDGSPARVQDIRVRTYYQV